MTQKPESASPQQELAPTQVTPGTTGGPVVISDATALSDGQYSQVGNDLIIVKADGSQIVVEDYFLSPTPADLTAPGSLVIPGAVVSQLASSRTPGQYAQSAEMPTSPPIGTIETALGNATITRTDGTVVSGEVGTMLYRGDIIETGEDISIGILLADDTTLSLGENGRVILNEMIYDPEAQTGQARIDLLKGVFSFVSGQIAKTGSDAMVVQTPLATIGIRGTAGGIELDENGEVTVALLPEEGDFAGEIVVTSENGTQIINQPLHAVRVGMDAQMSDMFTMSDLYTAQMFSQALVAMPHMAGIPDSMRRMAAEAAATRKTKQSDAQPEGAAEKSNQDDGGQETGAAGDGTAEDQAGSTSTKTMATSSLPSEAIPEEEATVSSEVTAWTVDPLTEQGITEQNPTPAIETPQVVIETIANPNKVVSPIMPVGPDTTTTTGTTPSQPPVREPEGSLPDEAPEETTVVQFTGTSSSDVVSASPGYESELDGQGGDDWLFGAEKQDEITGGEGNDQLFGFADHDVLDGGDGDDTLVGGEGDDTLTGGAGNDRFVFSTSTDKPADTPPETQDLTPTGSDSSDGSDTSQASPSQTFFAATPLAAPTVNSYASLLDRIRSLGTDTIKDFDFSADRLVLANADFGLGNGGNLDPETNFEFLDQRDEALQLPNHPANPTEKPGIFAVLVSDTTVDLYYTTNLDDKTQQNSHRFARVEGDNIEQIFPENAGNGISLQDNFVLGYQAVDGNPPPPEVEPPADNYPAPEIPEDSAYNQVLTGTTETTRATTSSAVYGSDLEENSLYGSAEDDKLIGRSLHDRLFGNDGDDVLIGQGDSDTLFGGAGRDYLIGGTGSDYLHGDAGDDYLEGGEGTDHYVFSTEQGFSGTSASERLAHIRDAFGTDVIDNFEALDPDGPDEVIVLDYDDFGFSSLNSTNFRQSETPPAEGRAADGQSGLVWRHNDDGTLEVYYTTNVDDFRAESSHRLIVIKGAGDSYLTTDHFTLQDLPEDNTLNPIVGDDEDNLLFGTEGKDHIQGKGGDDYLHGGVGDDYLEGGEGTDHYVFSTEQGFSGTSASERLAHIRDAFGTDVIDNFEALDPDGPDEAIVLDYDDFGFSSLNSTNFRQSETPPAEGRAADGQSGLVWRHNDDGTLEVYYTTNVDDFRAESSHRLIVIKGAGDSYLTADHFTLQDLPEDNTLNPIVGDDEDNLLFGTEGKDHIQGKGGDDNLIGGRGNDTLVGGDGNDSFWMHSGDLDADFRSYGDGGQALFNNIKTLGTDTITDFNVNEDQIILNNNEFDLLSEAPSTSSPYVGLNAALLEYRTEGPSNSQAGSPEKSGIIIVMNADKTAADIYYTTSFENFSEKYSTLIAKVQAAEGTTLEGLTLDSFKLYVAPESPPALPSHGFEQVTMPSPANVLTTSNRSPDILGSQADDTLTGDADNNLLQGYAGDDVLIGGDGNDTLVGGTGTDYLDGGRGADTYTFASGVNYVPPSGQRSQLDYVRALGSDYIYGFDTHGGDTIVLAQQDFGLTSLSGTNVVTQTIDLPQLSDTLYRGETTAGIIAVVNGSGTLAYLYYTTNIHNAGLDNSHRIATLYGENLGTLDDSHFFLDDSLTSPQAKFGTPDNDDLTEEHATYLDGGDGNDVIDATSAPGEQTIHGGTGNDTIYGGSGQDTLYGGAGSDSIQGGQGDDVIFGGDGDDTSRETSDFRYNGLRGGQGDDEIHGGNGVDAINGDEGDDMLYGDDGDDQIEGGQGNDQIWGGKGSDTINSGEGQDLITGGQGDDVIAVTGSRAIVYGDGQTLTPIDFQTDLSSLHQSDQGINPLINYADEIGHGSDNITGGDGNDVLLGGGGDDTIHGGRGNDYVIGGSGADSLRGGEGDDFLYGNRGADKFIFSTDSRFSHTNDGTTSRLEHLRQLGMDTIYDFSNTDEDTIVLSANDFGFAPGSQLQEGTTFFRSVTDIDHFTGITEIGQSAIAVETDGSIYYVEVVDDDGTASVQSYQIAHLENAPTLTTDTIQIQ